MGLFGHKQQLQDKPPIDEASDGIQRFFDGYFADLRSRGRVHFEKAIYDHVAQFKSDLDTSIAKANTQLKEHIASQLDQQVAQNNELMKDAQEQALQTLTHSAETLQERHQQLTQSVEKSIADQQAALADALEETKTQIAAMQEAQAQTLQWLNQSTQSMQEQHRQLTEALQKNVLAQELMLVNAFEENMAQIIEHYLLGALGDQYDLKAQLPSIIKQMEANKQAIVDDMKL